MIPAGARVLVLDDDGSFVRSTVRLLRSWGMAAEGFTSPGELLAFEPGPAPACLILDLRMPGVGGMEVQERLSRSPRKLPVVFVSGHADVQAGVEAMKGGAVDFLSKPVEEGRLLEAVGRALEADLRAQAARARAGALRARVERLGVEERRVCELVATGLRDDQIAEAIGSSAARVRAARTRAMRVLEVESLVDLLRVVESARGER